MTGLPKVLEFQALLHNYIRAPSAQVLIRPLKKLLYYDKTEATEEGRSTAKVETRAAVDVKTYTDSVYENAGQEYNLQWADDAITINSTNFKDVVVWNPQENGRKMSDMEDSGWYVINRRPSYTLPNVGIGIAMYVWNQAMCEVLSNLKRDKIGWDDKF